jgi:hypothetical protein
MADRPLGAWSAVLVLLAFPLVAAATAFPAPAAAPEAALQTIDSCLSKLRPEIDVGYERIASRCPQLARRLEDASLSRWLPPDWKRVGNDLSAGGLRELRELLTAMSGDPSPGGHIRRPSIAALPAALAELAPANAMHNGWWPRTRQWLRDIFERGAAENDEDWLSKLVGQNGLSQTVIELISYVSLLLVVLLAGLIVANELRVGGVATRWGARLRRARAAGAPRTVEESILSWDGVQKAPLAQRPGMLLDMIVLRLTSESRLPLARGLTVRELVRAVRLPNERDRERLAGLASTSERVRFSNTPVPSDELAATVENGRQLLLRLSPEAAEGQS